MKKGITLISLIVTIVILLIVVSSVTITTVTITNNSKKTTFAKDLKTIEEAVISEYTTNGVLPVISSPIYTLADIKSLSSDSVKLSSELVENKDDATTNTFYKVDLTKLGIKNSSRGNEKVANDIYLVSSENLNIYYLKGLKTSDNTYFSITNALVKGGKITKKANEGTGSSDVVLANGIKLSKNKKIWTNEIIITLDIQKDEGDVIKYSVAGISPEKVVNEDKIIINAANLTEAEIIAIKTAEMQNKKVVVKRYDSLGLEKAVATMYIKNLDIEEPTMGNNVPTLTSNANENILNFTGMLDNGGSGIKEIRYEYNTKLSSNNTYITANTPEITIDNIYLNNSGKKGNDIDKISLPKYIREISVTWIDNAGNIGSVKKYSVPTVNLVRETSKDSINDYVKEGLVLHLDAINNTGSGHNDTIASWKNLVGDGKYSNLITFDMNGISGWTNNSLIFDGTSDYVNIPQFQQTTQMDPSKYTVEMIFTPKDNNTVNQNVYGLTGVNGSIGSPAQQTLGLRAWTYPAQPNKFYMQSVVGDNTVGLYATAEQEYNIGERISITYYNNNGEMGIYKNASNKITTSYTFTPAFNRDNMYIGWISATRYAKMELHSVRVYNRVLTEDEIKRNYATDTKRFWTPPDAIDSYIKDGLVLHYDGINNTGTGHSSSPTVWKDLSGNGNDGSITGLTIGTDNMENTSEGKITATNPVAGNQNITVEVITKRAYESQMGAYILSTSNLGNVKGIQIGSYSSSDNIVDCIMDTTGSGNSGFAVSPTTKFLVTHQIGLRLNDLKAEGYFNGVVQTTKTDSNVNGNNSDLYLFYQGRAGTYYRGKIYSVRIYNRVLTDEEIKNNYDVDRKRFVF